MTYTTQQLQAMSDHEINCALAVKLNVDHYTATGLLFTAKNHGGDNVVSVSGVTDYCNNPSDIMPMAFERRLSLIDCVNEYICTNDSYGYHKSTSAEFYDNGGLRYVHANPLRAIACLLLLMED